MTKFEIIKWPNGMQWLDLKPNFLQEQIKFAKDNSLAGFICYWHPKDNIDNFSVLEQFDVLALNIIFNGVISNESINQFKNLKFLKCLFSEPVTPIDFSNLKKLEYLEITCNKNVQGLLHLVNLKEIQLWKYKPATKDLSEFKQFKNLNKIMLVRPNIESFDGIEGLDELIRIEVNYCKNLTSFFKTPNNVSLKKIESLSFSFCKDFDFESIPMLKTVTQFAIADNGKMETIKPIIKKFPNLKMLRFVRSELTDGNLDYLLEHPTLEDVTIDNKKHYNMKEKEINAKLKEKQNYK